ncbi:MAG: terminase large subunit domain-containing protein [bacterium]
MVRQIEPTDEKFIESFELDEWEIETEDGWKDITHLHKTIKYDVWELKTLTHSLKCADDHIVMVEGFKEKFVKDLDENDNVITKNGLEKVVSVEKLEVEPEEMYDLTVDSEKHTLFTNGILSHNSTISSVFLLWYSLFHKDKTVAIMANKESLAIEMLDKIKMAYQQLPKWLQQGIQYDGWNKKKLSLENGSRIIAAATSSNALTGYTINLLYLDEFAKVPQYVADDFIASVYPVVTSGKSSKIIMVSTPLGLNQFYNFWVGATRKDGNENSFYPISVGWWEVPGRDEKFKQDVIKDIGLNRWEQEFSCKFLGSNSTLIDSDILERIVYKVPIATKWTGLFSIYEQPLQNKEYVLGVDVGKGVGKDYSVIQVLKIESDKKLEQVGIYRSNLIIPHDFAQIVVSIAKFYNNAHVMVENNDIGHIVCDSIWYEIEYEELVNLDAKALGVRSTRRSKKIANMMLKEYLEKGWLDIYDERTVYELSRYEEIKPGVYAAGKTEHDDAVTSLLWALYFVQTDEFEGKSYNFEGIEDKYNVEMGDWEIEDGEMGAGDGWEPSVFIT